MCNFRKLLTPEIFQKCQLCSDDKTMLILKQRTGHKPTYLLTTGACGSVQQYWILLQNLPSK